MIDLNTFLLESYDRTNLDHRYISAILGNDVSVRQYISPDFDRFIEKVKLNKENDPLNMVDWYIAYLKRNEDNIPIGMIALDNNFDVKFESHYQVDYCLLPEYRGENLALMLLQQFSYYMLDEVGIEELYGIINPSNIASIKIATKVGFNKKDTSTYTMKR